ncbi:MAG: ribosomal protein L7/L12 [Akkermansiaceae bacterium]|nr:ribosomal protein L7/L12 [Armatimonadota bacterium]
MYSRLYPLDDETEPVHVVVLLAAGDRKIQVIKTVREITGSGLKECLEAVDSVPQIILRDVTKQDAIRCKNRLEVEGALVEIR